jgi:hypothetical protein
MAEPAAERDGQVVAARLTAIELEILSRIVRAGFAENTSDAIRVAIRVAPMGLSAEVVADIDALKRKVDELSAHIDTQAEIAAPISRLAKDRLVAFATAADPSIRKAATEELLRRGFFPDGLGDWVEDRPNTTIPGRTGGRVGSPRGPR